MHRGSPVQNRNRCPYPSVLRRSSHATEAALHHSPWSTTVVDQAAIDHERIFGCIVLADNDNVLIRPAQRVDFNWLADPVTTRVSNPRIALGSYYELTGPQARRAGGFLIEAADFVDRIATRDDHISFVRAVFAP